MEEIKLTRKIIKVFGLLFLDFDFICNCGGYFFFCTSKNNGSIIYVYLIYNNYIRRNNSGTQCIVIGFENGNGGTKFQYSIEW